MVKKFVYARAVRFCTCVTGTRMRLDAAATFFAASLLPVLRYSVKKYFSCSCEDESVKTYFSYVEKFPPFSGRRTVRRAVNGPG